METQEKVRKKLLEQLYAQAFPLVFIFPITSGFIVYFLIDDVPRHLLLIWFALALIQSLFRIFISRSFAKNNDTNIDLSTWERAYYALEIAGGLLSGMSGYFFTYIGYEYQLVLLFFLLIQLVGATPMFSPVVKVYYCFVFTSVPVMIFWLLDQQHSQLTLLSLLFVACVFLLVNSVRKLNHSLKESITLQLENNELIEQMSENNKELVIARNNAENANKAKSAFLANISHELRTPMHGILGFAELGTSKVFDAPLDKLQSFFSQIHSSGERLLALLNDLLDLSKLEAGQMEFNMETNNLLPLLENCISENETLLKKKSIRSSISINTDSLTARLDPDKIMQVLHNLISNAIKFSDIEGEIKIVVEDTRLDSVPGIKVNVIDKGQGIPADELESVFEKFVQSSLTKTGTSGTGLGLAIVKEIIEGHKGRIYVNNNEDKGACFSFILPR